MLLELYIVPQDYVLSEAVLSKVLIGVDSGLSLLALSRPFTGAVSPYSFVLKLLISKL